MVQSAQCQTEHQQPKSSRNLEYFSGSQAAITFSLVIPPSKEKVLLMNFLFIKVTSPKVLYSGFMGFHCQLLTRGKTRARFETEQSQRLRPEPICPPTELLHHLWLD